MGGGFAWGCGALLIGYGYHHFESKKEPLQGGRSVFTLTGATQPQPRGAPDCQPEPGIEY